MEWVALAVGRWYVQESTLVSVLFRSPSFAPADIARPPLN